MIPMAGIQDLKTRNPFLINASPDPWEKDAYPDIRSIHAAAYNRLHELVEQKKKNPTKDIGIIFAGDGGIGKSHLLWRLCSDVQHGDSAIFLASINPHIDQKKPMQYLIDEIVRNFSHEVYDFAGCTQFHRLVTLIMQEFLQTAKTSEELFQNTGSKKSIVSSQANKAISWLVNENIYFQKKTIQFLFQCCDPKMREQACEKLKNESESSAQEHLLTLGLLISRYQRSLLICFDQLESIEGNEIRSFEKIILAILGYSQGILPFILVRTNEWHELSTKKMDVSVVQRFGNSITSTPCTEKEIQELIISRFQFTTDTKGKKKGKAWLISEILKILPEDPTPRHILNIASKVLDPSSEKQDLSSLVSKVATYFAGKERKYETVERCKKDLALSDGDVTFLKDKIPSMPSPPFAIRDLRQWIYFVALPLEDSIIGYARKNPDKSLKHIVSWLPMTKEEFCSLVTGLHEQKNLSLLFSASKGASFLVHVTDVPEHTLSNEIENHAAKIQALILSHPEMSVIELAKELSLKKNEFFDAINYCLQIDAVSVHVFLNDPEIDFKFFIANEKTLKVGYDALHSDHAEYVMIHRLRHHLNWSRDAFDSLLDNLEKVGVIQLQASDPGLLTAEEQKDIYVRNDAQKMLLYWQN